MYLSMESYFKFCDPIEFSGAFVRGLGSDNLLLCKVGDAENGKKGYATSGRFLVFLNLHTSPIQK